jgi:hypothetical protein
MVVEGRRIPDGLHFNFTLYMLSFYNTAIRSRSRRKIDRQTNRSRSFVKKISNK